MTSKMLVEQLDNDHEDNLNGLSKFRLNMVWIELIGQGNYDPHTMKSSKIGSLMIRTL